MNPFEGAAVLLVLGFPFSVPAFALLSLLFFLAFRHARIRRSIVVDLLAAPACAALAVYLLALALQLAFGVVRDYP